VREIPEAKKPRQIAINAGAPKAQVIESSVAA
jgi:molecular chaperone IbpA